MLTPVAYTLGYVLIAFILFIGARFLYAPQAAAAGYGVPAKADGDPAYLTIKGLRDMASGVIGLALLVFAGAHAAGWFMLAVAVVPFGDTLIVLRHGGSRAVAFGIHFATAVVVVLSGILLLLV
ncbi:DUF4267 domain-containing protein [Actinomadura parmotrematis]|uniref:DUF4267 domain-containing protein n=1 Tax=Actinomadura parmotrematis TaxID=2864039 RepID=A0ABS7FSA7_9ACTN|nr:DUF4267 domain-containing protein [Actinomadura parmotrematis]MBW8483100.1 DUF4267 domain-containing protein [Actinomadura parmotrematis]